MTIDENLLEDIQHDTEGWVMEDRPEFLKSGYIDGNKSIQMIFSEEHQRAGFVFVGSGSSGLTHWTDAISVEDAWDRWDNDNLSC